MRALLASIWAAAKAHKLAFLLVVLLFSLFLAPFVLMGWRVVKGLVAKIPGGATVNNALSKVGA